MARQHELEPEHPIQKWAPYVVGAVLVVAIGFYFWHFPSGFSHKQSVWGQFGDFIGGLVNPIIGFFTIWLLAVSLRQNNKALGQANAALTQAKAELELTRIAIDDAKTMQAATEAALTAQTEIASQAKDMNNAIALFQEIDRQYTDFNKLIKHDRNNGVLSNDPDMMRLERERREAGNLRAGLATLLSEEANRLIKSNRV